MKFKITLSLLLLVSFASNFTGRTEHIHLLDYTLATTIGPFSEETIVIKSKKKNILPLQKKILDQKNRNPNCFGTYCCIEERKHRLGNSHLIQYVVSCLLLKQLKRKPVSPTIEIVEYYNLDGISPESPNHPCYLS